MSNPSIKEAEAAYAPLQNRKRSVLAAGLAVAIAVGGLGSTALASLTVETLREGNSVTGEAKAGMAFTDESGVIIKNISPGESAEDFAVTATNIGNISGHAVFYAKNLDTANLSDGFLDNTYVTITLRGRNNDGAEAQVTLRDFAANGYLASNVSVNGNFVITPGQNVNYTVRITPPTNAENFTTDDLIVFSQEFTLGFTFSAVDNAGNSDLSRWAAANATVLGNAAWGGMYSIPQSEIANASQNGVTTP